ncbi:MAG: hypothetical protein OEW90_00880 [Betaproteobacteria bacterium]|nr:hypothetical protein [Betaproteobacteria bacterium]MDH4322671.1 hypothetical protein [Betaproteobacteria bacterium]
MKAFINKAKSMAATLLASVLALFASPREYRFYVGVPAAAGHPQYSGTFIPEIWSGKLVEKFYDATVFGEIANTDYEGEISKMGDKVIIRTVPTIVIRDYQKGANLQYQRPESPNVELLIDKAKYFAFVVDDIDKFQSDLSLMDDWAGDGGEQMKIVIDTQVLGTVVADVPAANKGLTAGRKSASFNLGTTGTPFVLTAANVVEFITACSTVADEQNWPEGGRWMVIPPWMRFLLMNSDLKNASLAGDESSILRNGRLGMIDRFMMYVSNNISTASDGGFTAYNVLFGHKSAITFAAQMTEMDSLKAESTFGTLVRGLNVYGFEVIKTEALGLGYVRKG